MHGGRVFLNFLKVEEMGKELLLLAVERRITSQIESGF